MNIKSIGLFVGLISFTVAGDDFEHCNSLIEHGITNVTRYMSAEHSISYIWHSNCGQDFNSASDNSVRKASISIFGYGSGGGGFNSANIRKRLNEWCEVNKDFASKKHNLFEEARVISEPALDAWNQCQRISKKGVLITPSIQGENDEFIHFTVDSTDDGTHLFYGVSQTGYTCKVERSDGSELLSDKIDEGRDGLLIMSKSRPKITNSNIHISCRRNQPDISEVDGVGTLVYPQGHISVMTSGPALPITVPKVVESYYVTPPNSVLAFAANSCPKGWREYTPAYGRFIRGIDKSKSNIDPDGLREYGKLQSDGFKAHNHGGGDHSHKVEAGLGGIGPKGPRTGSAHDIKITTRSGEIIQKEGTSETRPKNVALLFCEKVH